MDIIGKDSLQNSAVPTELTHEMYEKCKYLYGHPGTDGKEFDLYIYSTIKGDAKFESCELFQKYKLDVDFKIELDLCKSSPTAFWFPITEENGFTIEIHNLITISSKNMIMADDFLCYALQNNCLFTMNHNQTESSSLQRYRIKGKLEQLSKHLPKFREMTKNIIDHVEKNYTPK